MIIYRHHHDIDCVNKPRRHLRNNPQSVAPYTLLCFLCKPSIFEHASLVFAAGMGVRKGDLVWTGRVASELYRSCHGEPFDNCSQPAHGPHNSAHCNWGGHQATTSTNNAQNRDIDMRDAPTPMSGRGWAKDSGGTSKASLSYLAQRHRPFSTWNCRTSSNRHLALAVARSTHPSLPTLRCE